MVVWTTGWPALADFTPLATLSQGMTATERRERDGAVVADRARPHARQRQRFVVGGHRIVLPPELVEDVPAQLRERPLRRDLRRFVEGHDRRFRLAALPLHEGEELEAPRPAEVEERALAADHPTAQAVLAVIQQHSLPDSRSARWLQLQQQADWSVAEVAFDTLNPSLVVLRLQGGEWRVQDKAVWSGSTAPWHSGNFVRRYLRQQAPDLPQALWACVSVDPARYGTGPGGLGPVAFSGPRQP